MRALILTLLISSSCLSLRAQHLILRPLELAEEIDALDLAQDKYGALWIMTDKELFTYDGYQIEKRFHVKDESDRFSKIFCFGERILVGTLNGSILSIVSDSLYVIESSNEFPIHDFFSWTPDIALVASYGGGILELDFRTDKISRIESNSDLLYINEIKATQDHLYIASDRGLWNASHALDDFKRIEGSGHEIVKNLSLQGDSIIWTTEFNSVIHRLDLNSGRRTSFSLEDRSRINDMAITNDRLFISSEQAMYQINLADSKDSLELFLDEKSSFGPLFIDDEQNIWTSVQGMLNRASLLFSVLKQPLEKEVHSLAYDGDFLVIGTDNGILTGRASLEHFQAELPGLNVTSMDSKDGLFAIGTYNSGCAIIDKKSNTIALITKDNDLQDNTVLAVKFISTGELVIATVGGTSVFYQKDGKWTRRRIIEELDFSYVLCIEESKNGTLWFGLDRGGAFSISNDTLIEFSYTTNGADIGSIFSIANDDDDHLWLISEQEGLLLLINDSLHSIPSPHGQWDTYTSLISTQDGRLLMIGDKEVLIYDHDNHELMGFNEEIVLNTDEAFLNCYVRVNENVLFEHNGSLYFYHDSQALGRTSSLTSLVDVSVNLQKIDTSRHVFYERNNSFSFEFKGVLHRNPERIFYSYILEGFDEEWRTTKDRSASYPHLSPGKYRFKVKSSHDEFNDGQEYLSYHFEIKRNIYNRIWFRALMILGIGILVYYYLLRRRRERELRAKLELFNTETQLLSLKSQLNPHFLFNSFNTVIGLIEEDKERSIEFVEHLTDFYRSVLEIGSAELVPIEKEISLVRNYVHLLQERFQSGLKVTIQEDMTPSMIPPLSLQLLIENAVKHNVVLEESPLNIRIYQEGEHIVIQNDLRPRISVKESMGIGLNNIRQRYQLLSSGQVQTLEDGQSFIVRLPLIPA